VFKWDFPELPLTLVRRDLSFWWWVRHRVRGYASFGARVKL